jgi:hypothetical protein
MGDHGHADASEILRCMAGKESDVLDVRPITEGLMDNLARRGPDIMGPSDGTNGLNYLLNATLRAESSAWNQFVGKFWDWIDSVVLATGKAAMMYTQAFPDDPSSPYYILRVVDDEVEYDYGAKELSWMYYERIDNESYVENTDEGAKRVWGVIYWLLRNMNKAADKTSFDQVEKVIDTLLTSDTRESDGVTRTRLGWLVGNVDGTDGQETYKMRAYTRLTTPSYEEDLELYAKALYNSKAAFIKYFARMARMMPEAFPP